MAVIFTGGTDLAVVASKVADDVSIGSWLEPCRVGFRDVKDADAFEALLREQKIGFQRAPQRRS